MRVLVTGGRDFKNFDAVAKALTEIHQQTEITLLIHGGATGADLLAERWAKLNAVWYVGCPANWTKQGKAAGPLRNRKMLKWKPDLVVAFPGGRGTADMILAAREARVEVLDLTGKATQAENEGH